MLLDIRMVATFGAGVDQGRKMPSRRLETACMLIWVWLQGADMYATTSSCALQMCAFYCVYIISL